MTNKRFYAAAAALLAMLALSACGGGNTGTDTNGQTANAGAADAFYQRVLAVIGTTSETAEPIQIDAIAATTPETIEPAPL